MSKEEKIKTPKLTLKQMIESEIRELEVAIGIKEMELKGDITSLELLKSMWLVERIKEREK